MDDTLPFHGYQQPRDIDNMHILGKDTYGMVYLGRHTKRGQPITTRQALLPDGYCQDLVKEEKLQMKGRAMKESMFQRLLSGLQYIPKTIDEDLCTGTNYPLKQAIKCFVPNPRLNRINMLQVCENTIKGIMELHQEGYLHNDLKSLSRWRNEAQRWNVVIIDLGLVSTIAYFNQKRFSD